MSTSALIAIMCIFGCLVVEAKVFTKCQLAKELSKNKNIPKEDIKDYVCLARWESNYNSRATNTGNKDKSADYGIFQINNRYWCKDPNKSSSNTCKLSCSALVDDSITDDINCAVIVKKQQGFSAWEGWKNKCKGKNLDEYISGCGI